MNDQWLKSFIISAECGSFSKAARASFISTTALVQQMNLFEKELGFQVFHRSNSGLKLTDAGEDFYKTAKELQKVYESGKERASKIAESETKILRIGFAPYQFPEKWLNRLTYFCSEQRKLQIQMKSIPMREQIKGVHSNSIDACIIAKPKKEYMDNLSYLAMYEDTYSFCMRKGHPLTNRQKLTLEDVKDYTIICGKYPYMEQEFEQGLATAAKLRKIETEYDITTRFEIGMSDDLFVVHSAWSDAYLAFYSVADTDISAGEIGIVYNSKCERLVKEIYRLLMDK